MLGGRFFSKRGRAISADDIREALTQVIDPVSGRNIVALGWAQGVAVNGDQATVALEVDPARAAELEPVRMQAQRVVAALPGVARAMVALTAHDAAPKPAAAPQAPVLTPAKKTPPPNEGPIEGVKRLIAVGSGKGGVGKSTLTVNLAVALAAEGRKVGLLDADIYGPSQARMLGLSGKPKTDAEGRIIPSEAFGVKLMSMGLLLEEGTAVIWRGPMLIKSLRQMLRGVAWGELDYLFIDLPPGTGDVQLTLAQQTRVDGAVIVSTPQDIALIDARKAIDMFNKTSTPIVGLVENMAMFVCPHCGGETDLFGHGGAQAEAEKTGLRFLGAIPLHAETRRSGDAGTPAAADPAHPQCAAFRAVAAAMDAALERNATGA